MDKRPRVWIALLVLGALMALGQAPGLSSGRPPAPGEDVRRLESLLLDGSFREAGRLAAQLLADPGADARARAVCGLAVLSAGRVAEAEAIFGQVISLQPDNPEAHLGLGRIARIRNDADAAVSHLGRAVPSPVFYAEALRQLWKAAWERGRVSDLLEIYKSAEDRYALESQPLPARFANGLSLIQGLRGKTLFEMEGRFERIRVPLLANPDRRIAIRMIGLALNEKGEYPFDIDSASADFLTLSPLLAEELGLPLTGSSNAVGVGTAAAAVRFSVLDRVGLGPVVFRNVPVMVSDLFPFRGRKKGLLGTALLKRFNVTIDVAAGVMELYPLERPELLRAGIDRMAISADVPLYLYDATTVEASLDGAPPELYILDSAAATNLVDADFFREQLEPKLDPSRIVRAGIQGAQGPQSVDRVEGLPIALGPLVFSGQTVHEFSMAELNAIGGRYTAGLVGNPLLWPYRVHMDFRRGRLILERPPAPPASGPPLDPAFD